MSFAAGFGFALLRLTITLLDLYSLVIIVRALLSWVSPDPHNPIVQILVRLTEPLLRPLRRLLPPGKLAGLDLSPMLALLLVQLLRYTLVYTIAGPVPF